MTEIIKIFENLRLVVSTFPLLIQFLIWGFIINILFISLLFSGAAFYFNLRKTIYKEKTYKHKLKTLDHKINAFFKEALNADISLSSIEINRLFNKRIGRLSRVNSSYSFIVLANLIKTNRHLKHTENYRPLLQSLKADTSLAALDTLLNPVVKTKLVKSFAVLDLAFFTTEISHLHFTNTKAITSLSKSPFLTYSHLELVRYFNNNPQSPINTWDQIVILNRFKELRTENTPHFGKWVKISTAPEQLVLFCKLIAYFRQYSALKSLSPLLLETSEPRIKKAVIKTFGSLRYEPIEPNLFQIYPLQQIGCKLEILRTIALISSQKALAFLIKNYLNTNTHELKKKLAEVLFIYNKTGEKFIKKRTQSIEEISERLILLHVQNPLIYSDLQHEISQIEKITTTAKYTAEAKSMIN